MRIVSTEWPEMMCIRWRACARFIHAVLLFNHSLFELIFASLINASSHTGWPNQIKEKICAKKKFAQKMHSIWMSRMMRPSNLRYAKKMCLFDWRRKKIIRNNSNQVEGSNFECGIVIIAERFGTTFSIPVFFDIRYRDWVRHVPHKSNVIGISSHNFFKKYFSSTRRSLSKDCCFESK